MAGNNRKPHLDAHNANKGTQRGRAMVEASLRETGAGRSILVDKEGRVIAGNKTLEAWGGLADEDNIEVVHSDGQKLVVVQRDDLDLDDPKGLARRLAYLDNRSSEVGLAWDIQEVLASIDAGLDLDGLWDQHEIDRMIGEVDKPEDLWQGMPEFEQEDKLGCQQIIMHFETPEDVEDFARLTGQTITEKTKYLWYPAQARENLKALKYADES